jgi:RHS repeat-associated protein
MDGIGLYYYYARWYDPVIGRFVQPDPIVPEGVQGTQAWDRYAYVNNNPVRFKDPSGHCINPTTDTCIRWDNPYYHTQAGNTCAVVSMAVSISTVMDTGVTQADIQALYPNTYVGIGVVPPQQPTAAIIDPRVRATFSRGNRADLENNVGMGIPSVVSFTLPWPEVGHAVVVVGQNTVTGQLVLFDPARNDLFYEEDFLQEWDRGRGFANFDALWADSNLFIPANSMVTVQPANTNIVIRASSSNFFWGGGSRQGLNGILMQ